MSQINDQAPHLVYKGQMEEIKRRFLAIDRILGAKKPRTLDRGLDDEFLWLQVRQIVEMIAFGAIAPDEGRYAEKRAGDGNGDYRQDWRAGKILDHLQKISPHFLPQPMGSITAMSDGTKHIELGDGVATLDRLKLIHETAGDNLHAKNPYGIRSASTDIPNSIGPRDAIKSDVGYLKSVIWNHYKIGLDWKQGDNPLALSNGKMAWLVNFGSVETPAISMMLAEALPTT